MARERLMFSSPMGYLYFYSEGQVDVMVKGYYCSRPLWGIYISIQHMGYTLSQILLESSRPLWGIYISIHMIKAKAIFC